MWLLCLENKPAFTLRWRANLFSWGSSSWATFWVDFAAPLTEAGTAHCWGEDLRVYEPSGSSSTGALFFHKAETRRTESSVVWGAQLEGGGTRAGIAEGFFHHLQLAPGLKAHAKIFGFIHVWFEIWVGFFGFCLFEVFFIFSCMLLSHSYLYLF